jgi:polygalacturonase
LKEAGHECKDKNGNRMPKLKRWMAAKGTGLFLLILLAQVHAQSPAADVFYNVLRHGVVADGITKNTESIRSLIEQIAKQGGGTLYFPAGEYLTGPIHLKSNITLYLESGSVLKFSQDFNDYLPMVQSRWEGTEVINFSPQIYAYGAENITIRGRGLIDGQGTVWWAYRTFYEKNPGADELNGVHPWQKEFVERNKNTASWYFWNDKKGKMTAPFLRPPMIQPVECKNILIEGVSIKNPPFWTINPVYCENLTIDGITITNPAESPNTDGINPDACRYVHISNCHISVGDDCITIKSGRDADGRRVGRACENITITNCTMLDGHGGVVIGSEMSGGVRKVTISNCVFEGTDRGIRLKSMRGRGGIVEDIQVSNIVMKNILGEAITLNMFYAPTAEEPASERTPCFRNIHFSNFTVTKSARAGTLLGLPEMPIEDITFNQMNIDCEQGFYVSNSRDIGFHNLNIKTGKGPAIRVENASRIEFDNIKMNEQPPAIPILSLLNVQNVFIHDFWPGMDPARIVKLEGKTNRDVLIEGQDYRSIHIQGEGELEAKTN